MRQVRRRDDNRITWLAGERCLTGENGVGIERIRRRRGNARLSEEGPQFRGFDDRFGCQAKMFKSARRIKA